MAGQVRQKAAERIEEERVRRLAEKAITAWSAAEGEPSIDPAVAVLRMLQMSWLRVHLYSTLLEYQVEEAQAETTAEGEHRGEGAGSVGVGAGLIGHTFSANPAVGVFASGEAVRALAQLEAAERDRCVRYAKTAHDMGIAEQQVELSKAQGELLARVVGAISQGLLGELVGLLEGEPGGETLAARVRGAWPAWVGTIAPRELRAAQEER